MMGMCWGKVTSYRQLNAADSERRAPALLGTGETERICQHLRSRPRVFPSEPTEQPHRRAGRLRIC